MNENEFLFARRKQFAHFAVFFKNKYVSKNPVPTYAD